MSEWVWVWVDSGYGEEDTPKAYTQESLDNLRLSDQVDRNVQVLDLERLYVRSSTQARKPWVQIFIRRDLIGD